MTIIADNTALHIMKVKKIQIVAGISLNGKIADKSGDFSKYSSKEDQAFLRKMIKESDVLVMGRKTFEKHVAKPKRPIIVFTRKVRGLAAKKKAGMDINYFNDSKKELLNLLDLLQYRVVTVLGGAEIYHWFIKENLVTDIFLTVEPCIIDAGKNILRGSLLDAKKSWPLKSMKQINQKGSLLLHYQE